MNTDGLLFKTDAHNFKVYAERVLFKITMTNEPTSYMHSF